MLSNGENFAFARFSDGEVDILKNIHLSLQSDRVIEGDKVHSFGYPEDDHKEFIPEKHQFVREALLESFKFRKPGYYKGIGDPCCNGEQYVKWMRDLHGYGDEEHLTWANLLVNGNYGYFISVVVPVLASRDVVLICSENADLSNVPLNVVKDFRVGKNCIVNDHDLVDMIAEWVEKNNIENHVFLFSASSLSEVLIHKMYQRFENNTYLDIGTTLHPFLGLDIARDYLRAYWSRTHHPDLEKKCNWLEMVYTRDNESKYWDDILDLRNHPAARPGFVNQEAIDKDTHYRFMKQNGDKYIVCLIESEFVGFAGSVDGDIRVAVRPEFQGRGFGKYLIRNLIYKFPQSCAKIKKENKSSIKIFEANNFVKTGEDKEMIYMERLDVTQSL